MSDSGNRDFGVRRHTPFMAIPDGTATHRQLGIAIAGGLVLLAHLLLLAPLPVAWRGAAALLLLGLPGVLLTLVVFGAERDPLLLTFLGLCGGIAVQVLLLLALHALPGPLPWWLVLLPFDALSGLLGWLLLRRQSETFDPAPPRSPHHYLPLALFVLLGVLMRFPFLGSAEFQGDEANVVLLAVDAVIGHDAILLLHRKGPVEVLLPTGLLALTGQLNEWVARLPFALAGVGIPLGSYLLACRMLDRDTGAPAGGAAAGVIAAAILALDGFLIAYSRMVQYQNVVVLMMLGALWCCWRFYEGAARPQPYLISAAVLVSVAGLSHYDGGFIVPALGWLVLAGGRRRGWRAAQWLREVALPLSLSAGLLLSFYVPFVLNQRFRSTLRNLMKRTGHQGGLSHLFNNLINYERIATFYNTTFQIHWLGVALAAAGIVWLWKYGRPRALGRALAALLLLGSVLWVWEPQRFISEGGGNWAILAFALPITGLAMSPATPPGLRTLTLWFGPPFIAEAFLIADPKTHFYAMDAAAALLIGLAVVQLIHWLRAHRLAWLRAPLALGGAALLLLAVPYLYLVFVRQTPEYRIVFPAARPDIYRASYRDKLPVNGGFFGFPHRAGWKVIGELYRQGVLQGDFESNEDYLMTLWYLGRVPRCDRDPAYYFLAQSPLDLVKVPVDQIQKEYHLFGSVFVDGGKQIDIYSRQPVTQPARIFALDDYSGAFDARRVISLPARPTLFDLVPQDQLVGRWQQGVLLQRAEMRRLQFVPGQSTTLVFHWRADQPLNTDDEVFVDVVDSGGRPVASVSRLCQSGPPDEWHAHESNTTSFTLTADASLPPGNYTLRVGLRDTHTGERLLLSDGADALTVATLTVVAR